MATTFFASSVTGSPKGSAVCTAAGGGGVCAAAGGDDGAGEGLAEEVGLAEGTGAGEASEVGLGAGAGLGDAAGAGVPVGEVAGAGDCAKAAPIGTVAAIMPAKTRRRARGRCISVFSMSQGAAVPISRPRNRVTFLTRKACLRPMTDAS